MRTPNVLGSLRRSTPVSSTVHRCEDMGLFDMHVYGILPTNCATRSRKRLSLGCVGFYFISLVLNKKMRIHQVAPLSVHFFFSPEVQRELELQVASCNVV